MSDWKHPTGKAPKNVVLVCLGASHADYIASASARDTPDWLLNAHEVWTLNRGSLVFKADCTFALDYLDGEAAHFPGYAAMLHRQKTPLITSKAGPDWPAHVSEYPFKAVWNWLMTEVKPNHQEWLINSVPLILLYAAYIGVKNMIIFGADYQGHSQKEDGASCLSYWIGVLERIGVKVQSPDSSQLLGGGHHFVYGFPVDGDPRPDAVARRARFKELINA